MLTGSNAVMFLQGTFDIANPDEWQIAKMLEIAGQISQSGFTTVLLGQWHVHEDGSIWYNDTALADVLDSLKTIGGALWDTTTLINNVLISFGPKGADFDNIGTNLAKIQNDILTLKSIGLINGIDFDLEEGYTSTQQDTLVSMTAWANDQGLLVTADPYDTGEIEFWTDLLRRTNTGSSVGFSWWNLQIYGGADYAYWVGKLQGLVNDPYLFLIAGYSVYLNSPSEIISAVDALKVTNNQGEVVNQPGGVFLWKFEYMNSYTYANMIAKALSNSS